MDAPLDRPAASFVLEGQFLGFAWDGDKPKHVQISLPTGEVAIKLAKPLRVAWRSSLYPGESIRIFGFTKPDSKTGRFKLKAYQIERLGFCPILEAVPAACPGMATPRPVKLLVCQKSGCQRRGGKRQQRDLETALRDRGLQDWVRVEETGCLGKCSLAPNIMLMPGKKRLSGMKPEAIIEFLHQRQSSD